MNEVYRLVPACFVALVLHVFVLSWQTQPEQVILPVPLAVQRIAVSLGARSVAKKPAPKQEPKQEVKKTKAVIPQPKSKVPEPRPVAKPVVQPVAKPQPVQQQEIVPPPAVPQETQLIHEETPPLHTEFGDESTTEDTTANVVQQASPLYQVNPPPKYPRLARRRGMEGVVILEVFVDVLGRAKELRIFNSSGHSVLDKAALKAVRRWKFSPGSAAGLSREMRVKVPVRFQLKDN